MINDLKIGDKVYVQGYVDEIRKDMAIIRNKGRFFDVAVEELKRELPAQPECKIGQWILIHPLQNDDCGAYMCSNCQKGDFDIDLYHYKYCPRCGAKMEVEYEQFD